MTDAERKQLERAIVDKFLEAANPIVDAIEVYDVYLHPDRSFTCSVRIQPLPWTEHLFPETP